MSWGATRRRGRSGWRNPSRPIEAAGRSLKERAPGLIVIVLDSDPGRALDLIEVRVPGTPRGDVLPASRSPRQRPDPQGDPRRCPRVPDAPGRARRAAGGRRPPVPARPRTTSRRRVEAAAGHRRHRGRRGASAARRSPSTWRRPWRKTPAHEVVLADFDLMLGSVDACLDLIPDHTLQEVVQNIDRLDLTLLKRSLTRHASGLYVLPHPIAMEDAAKIDPEALRRLLDAAEGGLPDGRHRHEQGAPVVRLRRLRDGRRDPRRRPARPDLPAEHGPAAKLFRQFEGLRPKVSWSPTASARTTPRSA